MSLQRFPGIVPMRFFIFIPIRKILSLQRPCTRTRCAKT